ncbi:MAG TPA: ThuA domain-containing protein [Isosphaeraceae bacterium]|nr:ThuA domain-containing protein [Isosphaeraceae bacterium]
MRITFGLSICLLGSLITSPLAADEPEVRMLVPGFEVRSLPVRITNANALAFVPDGRLFVATYSGKVFRLVDSDGDGLEDRAEAFWDRDTITTPISLLWAPEGLYVASHRKISLLRDDDHDGKADREEVVVSGWPPIENVGGNVDALGLALDREGNLFFGLGCANYANAYLVRDDGKARYDLKNERGTILKVSPDRKKREIVATGIRFPYAIRINRLGDLFATDQEGETWLPGGNPLDELNHIIPGRHYGFPPRNEKHLPNVADEPPVIGFGPQHQSACGLVFNESKAGWKAFGPASWEGNAIVAGFSRGKVWRVTLVKTPTGYVGKDTMVARSNTMVADVAVSPAGALYLTCHSGSPDWGTGPQGEGHLFKITYVDPKAPQPVVAWPAGQLETRVAFDKALDPGVVQGLAGQALAFGEAVRAADRYEVHKPPYKAVQAQEALSRGRLRIAAARLDDGGRTLVLTTDPHPWPVSYALTVPNVKPADGQGPGATVDVAYDLSGVEVSWDNGQQGAQPTWSGWWPHLDPDVVRPLTAGSVEHEQSLALLGKAGRLTLHTLVELPAGQATLTIESSGPVNATLGGESSGSAAAASGGHRVAVTTESTGEATDLELTATTGAGGKPLALHASFHTATDPTERPLPIGRLQVPWAPAKPPASTAPVEPPPALAGGDRTRGEAVFFSEQARCSVCHKVRGKGGEIGPELSNLVHRDAVSVYRDIHDPSATINPDYVSYAVSLKDGRVAQGIVRAEGTDAIRIFDTDAKQVVIPRAEISELRPTSSSLMPAGLVAALGEQSMRDLLAFLTTPPPEPPPKADGETQAKADSKPQPPSRSRAEVNAALGSHSQVITNREPHNLNIVLVASNQDHGPGEHDYPAWQKKWKALLTEAKGVNVSNAHDWPERSQWQRADLVVCYFHNHAWTPERYQELDAFLARGGGLVMLHAAVIADKEPEALAERLGLAAQPVRTKYRHGPLDLTITTPTDHPITRGLTTVHFLDETYWPPIGDPSKVNVLATAVEEGKAWPMLWTCERGKGGGRVFASILGHYAWTFDDPLFRIVLLRGLAWAASEPIDRFESLATSGVTLRNDP